VGHKVAGFSLAVSKEWTTRNGECEKKTSFLTCKAWGKDAEYIEQFRKGEGSLF
jgi:single-stranded DNA-binding protein